MRFPKAGNRWGREAAVVLALGVAGCTGWSGERPPSPSPPAAPSPTDVFLQRERAALASLSPAPVPALRIQVEGIDPILHDHLSLDPALQEQKAFWVEYWSLRQPDHFRTYLARMGRYGALVDAELEQRGMPASLRYLPIVESGYRSGAVSRVGATGLWQIMGPTARSLALTVSPIVDDRRDPVGNTRAALDFLQGLHRSFGSWHLALAAYNAGPARIRGLLARHAPDADLGPDERFLLIRPHLPPETRDFIPKLLAAAQVARDAPSLGLCPEAVQSALAFDEVTVPDATSLDVVAFAAGVPEADVVVLNPQYLRGFTPPGQSRVVRVPAGSGERFLDEYARIPPDERLSFLEHVVTAGETFTHIARRYRVPLAELLAANVRVDPRRLQIGTRVVVPVAGSVRAGS